MGDEASLSHTLTPAGSRTPWHCHPSPTRWATLEGTTMLAAQEARAFAGADLPVGEPVTLVLDDERFLGFV